jgi:thioesterase domain-containing protein
MLMPIHTSGTKPPLFLVHGMMGDVNSATTFAHALGPDRPLYAIHANGIDGREPVIDNMPDMVRAYVEQIRGARPTGPIHIGGFCPGGLTAIEVARALQKEGRQVGPVILADPPPVPHGFINERNRAVDPRHPLIASSLYRSVHKRLSDRPPSSYNDSPFDRRDPQQLHAATLAGVGSLIALCRHVPQPFFGSAQVIVSAPRAAQFFDPASPWHSLLPGPRMVHVVPWDHWEFFGSGGEHVARVINFLLEESGALGTVVAHQRERTVA